MLDQAIPDIYDDVASSMRTNYVGIASFTILVWDHIITLADEVEYVWKGRKGPIIYLFFLNRYLTPLGFIINLYAYLSPTWTLERCSRFIRYEGCTVAIAIEIVGLMMLVRVRALYPRQNWLVWVLGIILLLETGVNVWLISRGEPVLHNPTSGVHACTMIFDPAISAAASSSAWIPLMYDSIVLGLTLYRTIPSIKDKQAGFITQRLLEDGLLYYSVIFSVTLVLTIMIVSAPPGVKNISAQLEQLLTVAMMSRITINLRKVGHRVGTGSAPPRSIFFSRRNRGEVVYTVQDFVSNNGALEFAITSTDTVTSLEAVVVDKDARPGLEFESYEMHTP